MMTQLTVSQPAAALLLAPPWPARGAGPGALDQDALLVAACRRGDQGALERLVERFQVAVVGTAMRLVGDRDVALELANMAFFKLARSLHRYDPARPLRPWVLRIATNEALNWLRGGAGSGSACSAPLPAPWPWPACRAAPSPRRRRSPPSAGPPYAPRWRAYPSGPGCS